MIYAPKAEIALFRGDRNAAIRYWSKAIELNQNNDEYYDSRGRVYTQIENFETAIKDFKYAVYLNNEHSFSYLGRGECYSSLEKWEEAFKDIVHFLMLENYALSSYELVLIFTEGEFEHDTAQLKVIRALDTLNELIKEDTSTDIYLILRGAVYEYLELYQNAVDDYSRAISRRINPIFCRHRRKIFCEKMR